MGRLCCCACTRSLRFGFWLSLKSRGRVSSVYFGIALLLLLSVGAESQSKVATTTTLALTTNGGSNTTVAMGTVVTLTATVSPASGRIGTGQVIFCDALAAYCTDIHLLGTAQLTSTGAATFKFMPGAGTHSYKAVFAGNGLGLSSSSNQSR